MDECSTTTARKFVKLTDGSATPSIEVTAPTEQQIPTNCDHLTDPSIVPASDTNTAGMYLFSNILQNQFSLTNLSNILQ